MSIEAIKAIFACDGCDSRFEVELDNAATLPDGWTLTELAIDGARGGPLMSSVQDGMELCEKCTKVADAIGDEDHRPTRDEINAALERAAQRRTVNR
jgi:hypothetical protein